MGQSFEFYYAVILYEKVKPNNHGDIMGQSFEFYYAVILHHSSYTKLTVTTMQTKLR